MAHNLTDVDTYTAAVTVPDDGDTASAASVEAGFQDLADRTNWLYLRRPPSAYANLGDADATLSVGTDYHQSVGATAPRVMTLRSTTAPIPREGQRLRAIMCDGAGVVTVTFQREDTTAIAIFTGTATMGYFAVEFVWSGTVWLTSWVEQPAGVVATPWSSVVRV